MAIKKLSGVGDFDENTDSKPGFEFWAVEWKSPTKLISKSVMAFKIRLLRELLM